MSDTVSASAVRRLLHAYPTHTLQPGFTGVLAHARAAEVMDELMAAVKASRFGAELSDTDMPVVVPQLVTAMLNMDPGAVLIDVDNVTVDGDEFAATFPVEFTCGPVLPVQMELTVRLVKQPVFYPESDEDEPDQWESEIRIHTFLRSEVLFSVGDGEAPPEPLEEALTGFLDAHFRAARHAARLARLQEMGAPEVIVENQQQLVDRIGALILD